MKDGWGFIAKNPVKSTAFIIGTFMVSRFVWRRLAGYTNEVIYEQEYAKNVKMLRNLLIK